MAGCGQPWVHKEVTSADQGLKGRDLGVRRPAAGISRPGLPGGSFCLGYDFLNIHTFICAIDSSVYHHSTGLWRLWFRLPQLPAKIAVI